MYLSVKIGTFYFYHDRKQLIMYHVKKRREDLPRFY